MSGEAKNNTLGWPPPLPVESVNTINTISYTCNPTFDASPNRPNSSILPTKNPSNIELIAADVPPFPNIISKNLINLGSSTTISNTRLIWFPITSWNTRTSNPTNTFTSISIPSFSSSLLALSTPLLYSPHRSISTSLSLSFSFPISSFCLLSPLLKCTFHASNPHIIILFIIAISILVPTPIPPSPTPTPTPTPALSSSPPTPTPIPAPTLCPHNSIAVTTELHPGSILFIIILLSFSQSTASVPTLSLILSACTFSFSFSSSLSDFTLRPTCSIAVVYPYSIFSLKLHRRSHLPLIQSRLHLMYIIRHHTDSIWPQHLYTRQPLSKQQPIVQHLLCMWNKRSSNLTAHYMSSRHQKLLPSIHRFGWTLSHGTKLRTKYARNDSVLFFALNMSFIFSLFLCPATLKSCSNIFTTCGNNLITNSGASLRFPCSTDTIIIGISAITLNDLLPLCNTFRCCSVCSTPGDAADGVIICAFGPGVSIVAALPTCITSLFSSVSLKISPECSYISNANSRNDFAKFSIVAR
ncbi:hypothetical protein AX774_g6946 [Zancudomyces culisetae]|uniref:Uncharacterized protein n=1 Tax=Zancudomyces culisetae TaxID=1213189 RepID=A0A1R1PFG0_ZANCU|nr:hypothetical protein AX774_g6946 [Zancudomyces culisetae]|eukprot:OMH79643.1 hypothetical protein AX774_g6946 [Zancudomyces culisetae]